MDEAVEAYREAEERMSQPQHQPGPAAEAAGGGAAEAERRPQAGTTTVRQTAGHDWAAGRGPSVWGGRERGREGPLMSPAA